MPDPLFDYDPSMYLPPPVTGQPVYNPILQQEYQAGQVPLEGFSVTKLLDVMDKAISATPAPPPVSPILQQEQLRGELSAGVLPQTVPPPNVPVVVPTKEPWWSSPMTDLSITPSPQYQVPITEANRNLTQEDYLRYRNSSLAQSPGLTDKAINDAWTRQTLRWDLVSTAAPTGGANFNDLVQRLLRGEREEDVLFGLTPDQRRPILVEKDRLIHNRRGGGGTPREYGASPLRNVAGDITGYNVTPLVTVPAPVVAPPGAVTPLGVVPPSLLPFPAQGDTLVFNEDDLSMLPDWLRGRVSQMMSALGYAPTGWVGRYGEREYKRAVGSPRLQLTDEMLNSISGGDELAKRWLKWFAASKGLYATASPYPITASAV